MFQLIYVIVIGVLLAIINYKFLTIFYVGKLKLYLSSSPSLSNNFMEEAPFFAEVEEELDR
jgi:hypothetical protein